MREIFEVADDVVARVADCTALERRQLGQMHGFERYKSPPQLIKRIGRLKLTRPPFSPNGDLCSVGNQLEERLNGQEAVAPNLLTADYAFEQARIFAPP